MLRYSKRLIKRAYSLTRAKSMLLTDQEVNHVENLLVSSSPEISTAFKAFHHTMNNNPELMPLASDNFPISSRIKCLKLVKSGCDGILFRKVALGLILTDKESDGHNFLSNERIELAANVVNALDENQDTEGLKILMDDHDCESIKELVKSKLNREDEFDEEEIMNDIKSLISQETEKDNERLQSRIKEIESLPGFEYSLGSEYVDLLICTGCYLKAYKFINSCHSVRAQVQNRLLIILVRQLSNEGNNIEALELLQYLKNVSVANQNYVISLQIMVNYKLKRYQSVIALASSKNLDLMHPIAHANIINAYQHLHKGDDSLKYYTQLSDEIKLQGPVLSALFDFIILQPTPQVRAFLRKIVYQLELRRSHMISMLSSHSGCKFLSHVLRSLALDQCAPERWAKWVQLLPHVNPKFYDYVQTQLLFSSSFRENNGVTDALKIYLDFTKKNPVSDMQKNYFVNAIIEGKIAKEEVQVAFCTLKEMTHHGYQPNGHIFDLLIRKCMQLDKPKVGISVYEYMEQNYRTICLGPACVSGLIRYYGDFPDLSVAWLNRYLAANPTPDISIFEASLAVLSVSSPEKTIEIFHSIQSYSLVPSQHCVYWAICAYLDSDKIEKAKSLLSKYPYTIRAYEVVVKKLLELSRIDEAFSFISIGAKHIPGHYDHLKNSLNAFIVQLYLHKRGDLLPELGKLFKNTSSLCNSVILHSFLQSCHDCGYYEFALNFAKNYQGNTDILPSSILVLMYCSKSIEDEDTAGLLLMAHNFSVNGKSVPLRDLFKIRAIAPLNYT